ncbi:MAG TPA: glutathionylspermidine synthase family protein [Dehalococcoidia bacterium]|nr:glutathionylspermidine synthase family protein [Dehalococcoidia bacterium]
MQALITDPAAVSDRLWWRFADRAVLTGLFPDWLNRGEPYFSLNALVLRTDEAQRLIQASNHLARVFSKATNAVAGDVDRLVSYGFPWAAAELLAQEPPTPLLLGRFDFVPDAAGRWRVLEFNSDTPSGLREGVALDPLIQRLAPGAAGLDRPSAGLARAFTRQVIAAVQGPGPAVERIGLVTDAGMVEDLAQFAFTRDLLARALAPHGIEVVLGDLDNLTRRRGQLCLIGRTIQALYRYYPFEALLGHPAFPAIFDAVFADRLRLLNGLRGLLTQNKALLAWIWRHREDPVFTPAERAAIRDHLPPTHLILDLPQDFDYRQSVVKQVFGREGSEVYFGDRLSVEEWQMCRRWRSFIVQERVVVPALEAVVWRRRGAGRETIWPGIGAFVVGDQFAGCYSRIGGRIIDHSAKFVATFAEVESPKSKVQSPTW